MDLITDGVARLSIAGTGNVAIGGTPASYKFAVLGAGADIACSDSGVVTRMISSFAAGGGYVETASNHDLFIRRNQVEVARFSSTSLNLPSGYHLALGNAYAAGAPTATGYVVIKDSTGTSYKIPAVAL